LGTLSATWSREGGKLIPFFMLANTSGIGEENLCAVYLSVDPGVYTALVGENMDINIGVGKIQKRDIF